MNIQRPVAQPDLFTVLMGGTHTYAGGAEECDGYRNLVPANQDQPDIARLMKFVNDEKQFAALIATIVADVNKDIEEANIDRFQDNQFIAFGAEEVQAALSLLHERYKKNVELFCDMRPDLYLKYQQETDGAALSRGTALRMKAIQMACSGNGD